MLPSAKFSSIIREKENYEHTKVVVDSSKCAWRSLGGSTIRTTQRPEENRRIAEGMQTHGGKKRQCFNLLPTSRQLPVVSVLRASINNNICEWLCVRPAVNTTEKKTLLLQFTSGFWWKTGKGRTNKVSKQPVSSFFIPVRQNVSVCVWNVDQRVHPSIGRSFFFPPGLSFSLPLDGNLGNLMRRGKPFYVFSWKRRRQRVRRHSHIKRAS